MPIFHSNTFSCVKKKWKKSSQQQSQRSCIFKSRLINWLSAHFVLHSNSCSAHKNSFTHRGDIVHIKNHALRNSLVHKLKHITQSLERWNKYEKSLHWLRQFHCSAWLGYCFRCWKWCVYAYICSFIDCTHTLRAARVHNFACHCYCYCYSFCRNVVRIHKSLHCAHIYCIIVGSRAPFLSLCLSFVS